MSEPLERRIQRVRDAVSGDVLDNIHSRDELDAILQAAHDGAVQGYNQWLSHNRRPLGGKPE